MPEVSLILNEVLVEHGVSAEEIQGRDRRIAFMDARSCIAYRWRTECNLLLKEIGLLLGGRDHSTIINLLRRIPAMDKRLRHVS